MNGPNGRPWELGNERKALDFLMIAAHLSPKDAQLWYRLAEMSNRQRNPRQALYCLGHALKLDPEDVNNRWHGNSVDASILSFNVIFHFIFDDARFKKPPLNLIRVSSLTVPP